MKFELVGPFLIPLPLQSVCCLSSGFAMTVLAPVKKYPARKSVESVVLHAVMCVSSPATTRPATATITLAAIKTDHVAPVSWRPAPVAESRKTT